MKSAVVVCLLLLTSCWSPYPNGELAGPDSPRNGASIFNASLNKAILVQRTLYPYHFGINASGLNDLGNRDFSVLASHFRGNPGILRVRRGNATDELYDARLQSVYDGLVAAGVDADAISIEDGLPGGDGMTSERVLFILDEETTWQSLSISQGLMNASVIN